ncbi:MAG: hypothetical protein HOH19_11540 [Kordiimonadaceae bacterium]|jgi:hypothetical protein|nr:hypothetical protein [Kordiimonadaceae bacterium]MBT6033203.1 hypothetical protein [Kordiimonadaceae bacterium]
MPDNPVITPSDITKNMIINRSNVQDKVYLNFEKITDHLKKQLSEIESSKNDMPSLSYPCSVEFYNGEIIENAILHNMDEYLKQGGILYSREVFADDENKISQIKRIFPSKNRLPIKFSKEVHTYCETGMGYLFFYFLFDDGSEKLVVGGSAANFYDLPEGYDLKNIVGVRQFNREKDKRTDDNIEPSNVAIFRYRESTKRPSSGNPFYELSE